MTARGHFSPELLRFLAELKRNNRRDWFLANRGHYETDLREPFLRFISDFGPRLSKISRFFVADPRPSGGSLFRIYRDTRFSKDKSPYKTHAAAHFRHRATSKDVHAPGFYLHLEPGGCFAAAGLWRPDGPAVDKVRDAIVERSAEWGKVRKSLTIEGESLVRPPKGYDPGHRFLEDLKRKDFITSVRLSDRQVASSRFLSDFTTVCKKMSPLVRFTTEALGLSW
ncbi:MAG TPA: TIGR02453 family protein [Thermoanaerobaculia bacterium]